MCSQGEGEDAWVLGAAVVLKCWNAAVGEEQGVENFGHTLFISPLSIYPLPWYEPILGYMDFCPDPVCGSS